MDFIDFNLLWQQVQSNWLVLIVLIIQVVTMLRRQQYNKLLSMAAQESLRLAGKLITNEEKRDALVNYINGLLPFWLRFIFNERVVDELVEKAYKLKAKPVLKQLGIDKGVTEKTTMEQYLKGVSEEKNKADMMVLLKAIGDLKNAFENPVPKTQEVNLPQEAPKEPAPNLMGWHWFSDKKEENQVEEVTGEYWDFSDDEQDRPAINF